MLTLFYLLYYRVIFFMFVFLSRLFFITRILLNRGSIPYTVHLIVILAGLKKAVHNTEDFVII